MARSICLTLSALLALFSVSAQAKSKDQKLRMYIFSSNDCNGPTIGGNLDAKMGHCFNLVGGGAQSIRPFTKGDTRWIDDVNNSGNECGMIGYKNYGCNYGDHNGGGSLPSKIEECIPSEDGSQILSVLFTCDQNILRCLDAPVHKTTITVAPLPEAPTTTITLPVPEVVSTITLTLPDIPTTTITLSKAPAPAESTVYVYPPRDSIPDCADDDSDCPELGTPQSDSPDAAATAALVERSKWKGPHKGVWMHHPWTRALICYDCYARSDNNLKKFECRSGPKNPIYCGEKPDPAKPTTTTTIYPTETVTAKGVPQLVHLEKRSWHEDVSFTHPWFPDTRVCADAEWEKRGQRKSEVRLQKPKTGKSCGNDIDSKQASPVTLLGPTQTTTVVVVPEPVRTTVTIVPIPLTTSCTTMPQPAIVTVVQPQPVDVTTVTLGQSAPVGVTTVTLGQQAPTPVFVTIQQRKEHTDL
jgi:hypothetical protein